MPLARFTVHPLPKSALQPNSPISLPPASISRVLARSAPAPVAWLLVRIMGCFLMLMGHQGTISAQTLTWVACGPAPNTQGQAEHITDNEVVGGVVQVGSQLTEEAQLAVKGPSHARDRCVGQSMVEPTAVPDCVWI